MEPAKRGESVKPGVERSGTPGPLNINKEPAKRGESRSRRVNRTSCAVAGFARSVFLTSWSLGFHFALRQALCFHPLRGFRIHRSLNVHEKLLSRFSPTYLRLSRRQCFSANNCRQAIVGRD